MSFRLACELSDKIAAIAPFAGSFGIKNSTGFDCKGKEEEDLEG